MSALPKFPVGRSVFDSTTEPCRPGFDLASKHNATLERFYGVARDAREFRFDAGRFAHLKAHLGKPGYPRDARTAMALSFVKSGGRSRAS